VPLERWHEHDEFRARVLREFAKIPRYLAEGFLAEIEDASTAAESSAHMPR
jgi:hypothetical protein